MRTTVFVYGPSHSANWLDLRSVEGTFVQQTWTGHSRSCRGGSSIRSDVLNPKIHLPQQTQAKRCMEQGTTTGGSWPVRKAPGRRAGRTRSFAAPNSCCTTCFCARDINSWPKTSSRWNPDLVWRLFGSVLVRVPHLTWAEANSLFFQKYGPSPRGELQVARDSQSSPGN